MYQVKNLRIMHEKFAASMCYMNQLLLNKDNRNEADSRQWHSNTLGKLRQTRTNLSQLARYFFYDTFDHVSNYYHWISRSDTRCL